MELISRQIACGYKIDAGLSTCSLNDQQESSGKEKISKTTIALACFTFLFFVGALRLTVYAELRICSECSMFEIYDPLVIADAVVLLFVLLGLAYLVSKFGALRLRR